MTIVLNAELPDLWDTAMPADIPTTGDAYKNWRIKMTKQCYYCSYPNSDNATRCINCGQELKTYWDKSGEKPELVRKQR